MTRTIIAIATALAAMTLAPAAEACISCEYVPEVVRGSSTTYQAKPYKKSRSYKAAEERRARVTKKRIVKSEPVSKKVVKSEPVSKKVETAVTAPIKAQSENENSTISAAASDKSETTAQKIETAETTPIKTQSEDENSTISTATSDASKNIDAEETPVKEAKADKNVGCKKFFPTVGLTLSVPCE